MKKKRKSSIQRKIACSFGLILLIVMSFIGIASKAVIENFLTKQIVEDFEEEISIIQSVYREEIRSGEYKNVIEAFRAGSRKVGVLDLETKFLLIQNLEKPRFIPADTTLNEENRERILGYIRKERFNELLRIETKTEEYLIYIGRVKTDRTVKKDTYTILYAPVQEMSDLVADYTIYQSIIFIIAFSISMVMIVLISRSITKPIHQMKEYVNKIGRKEEVEKIEVQTSDELSELAQAMNNMAEQIEKQSMEQMRFLQNASHELKTPLMSIQGYAEGILDEVIEEKEEALQIIIEESVRLNGIVKDLSFLSKISTDQLVAKFVRIDIRQMMEKLYDKMYAIAKSKGVRIIIEKKEKIEIEADENRMIQALVNIVGNALRYAKEEIQIVYYEKNGKVYIHIVDDGNGIREKDMPHLFERFYKGKNGDTGLGLAITKAIIEYHGGEIVGRNTEDSGAEFVIIMPSSGQLYLT